VETNVQSTNIETSTTLAGFIHRNDQKSSPTDKVCVVRSRLTPSNPSKAGSMWFVEPVPVNNGFDTFFTFQITDHSKQCTLNLDQYFSLFHHRTCSVHGGDGFAFVIQNNKNSTAVVGQVGGQMGFGGIENSLAIAFDTWQNQVNKFFFFFFFLFLIFLFLIFCWCCFWTLNYREKTLLILIM
jgi:hypothetical protein